MPCEGETRIIQRAVSDHLVSLGMTQQAAITLERSWLLGSFLPGSLGWIYISNMDGEELVDIQSLESQRISLCTPPSFP